jgi:bla regulator protein blaR1
MSLTDVLSVDLCVRVVQVLIHSLWQGLLLAAVVAAVSVVARRRSASLRYAVGFAALLIMAACLPVTFWLTAPADSVNPPATLVRPSPEDKPAAMDTALPHAPAEPRSTAIPDASRSRPASPPVAATTSSASEPRPEKAGEPSAGKRVSPYIVAV